jgi:hypothetical protein
MEKDAEGKEIPVIPAATKTCTVCKKTLTLDHFTIKKGRPGQKDSYKSKCKDCINKISREVYYPSYDRYTKKPNTLADVKFPVKVEKQCRDCGETKPLTDFHPCCKNPTKSWHWQSYCKTCDAARHRQRAAEGYVRPEPDLALYLLEQKLKHVVGGIYQSGGSDAMEFTLTVKYIQNLIDAQTVNGVLQCAATKSPLMPDEKDHPFAVSIDRIDNSKGYIEGNVRLVALMYNLARRKWDDVDVIKAFKTIASGLS